MRLIAHEQCYTHNWDRKQCNHSTHNCIHPRNYPTITKLKYKARRVSKCIQIHTCQQTMREAGTINNLNDQLSCRNSPMSNAKFLTKTHLNKHSQINTQFILLCNKQVTFQHPLCYVLLILLPMQRIK